MRGHFSCGSGDRTEHAFDSVVIAYDMAIGVKATEAATVFCEEGKRPAKVQSKRMLTYIA